MSDLATRSATPSRNTLVPRDSIAPAPPRLRQWNYPDTCVPKWSVGTRGEILRRGTCMAGGKAAAKADAVTETPTRSSA